VGVAVLVGAPVLGPRSRTPHTSPLRSLGWAGVSVGSSRGRNGASLVPPRRGQSGTRHPDKQEPPVPVACGQGPAALCGAPKVGTFHLCPSWAHAHAALLFLPLLLFLQPCWVTLPPSRRICPEPLCPGQGTGSFETGPASPWRVRGEPSGASSWGTALCRLPQWHSPGTPASTLVDPNGDHPQVSAGETEAGGEVSQAAPKGPVPSSLPGLGQCPRVPSHAARATTASSGDPHPPRATLRGQGRTRRTAPLPSEPGSVPGSAPGSDNESHFPPEIRLQLLHTGSGIRHRSRTPLRAPSANGARVRRVRRAPGWQHRPGSPPLNPVGAGVRVGWGWFGSAPRGAAPRSCRSLWQRSPQSWAILPGASSLSLKTAWGQHGDRGRAAAAVPGWWCQGGGARVARLRCQLRPCPRGRSAVRDGKEKSTGKGDGSTSTGSPEGGKSDPQLLFAPHDPLQPLAGSVPGTPWRQGRAATGSRRHLF